MSKQPKPVSKSAFFTQPAEEEGTRMYLEYPDGTASGHWMLVYGSNSNRYRKAMSKMRRFLMSKLDPETESSPDDRRDEIELEASRIFISDIIGDWSVEEPCTEAEKLDLLEKGPHLIRQTEIFANTSSLHVKKKLSGSLKSQKITSK